MKKIKNLSALLLMVLILLPSAVNAQYIRPNNFMDKSGADKTAEIKRFQALNNIPVSGTVDKLTNDVLYNPDIVVRDVVEHMPTTGKWIAINKSKKTLTMYNGKLPMYKFPVALGTSATPTPSGKFKIQNKHVNPAWGGIGGKYTPIASGDPKNPLGKRWMGIYVPGQSGYGIHGTIKPHQIGQYVSNGCIRMFNYDVETFIFPNAYVGMPVWMGTDEELKSWGVQQVIEKKIDEVAPVPQKETPQVPQEPAYETGELLVF